MPNNTAENYFVFRYVFTAQYVICFFGIILHLLLFIVFIKDPLKCFRNSGNYLVVNLAVSDFTLCLLGPAAISATPRTILVECISNAHALVSVYTIFSISVDRFTMVRFPLGHRLLMSRKVMASWIAMIWLLAFLYPVQVFIFGLTAKVELAKNCTLAFVIVSTCVLYMATYFTLKRQSRNISSQNSTMTIANRHQEMRILKEQRFLTTIILIACIAFVCLVPTSAVYQVTLSKEWWYDGFTGDGSTKFYVLMAISGAMYFLNFAVNPCIYILRLPNYRKTFQIVYCRKQL